MKTYRKPVITIDSGMAEGVYAASGATSSPDNVSFLRYDGDWGTGGTAVYSVDLSDMNPNQLTVILTCNMDISGGWGSNASATTNGNLLTLTWYSAPSSAEISIQVQGNDVKQLKVTGLSYSNN